MKLRITLDTRIYVACPANVATGGPELLHQLVHRLNQLGHKAFMYYLPSDHPNPVHPQLEEYGNPFVRTIEDTINNILLVPETFPEVLESYQRLQKVIWWLSVDLHYDNSFKKTPLGRLSTRLNKWFRHLIDIEGLRANFTRKSKLPDIYRGYIHLVQSEYAHQHLLAKSIESIEYLSDYLNDAFIHRECIAMKRDIVLYNPNKGHKFTRKIIAMAPDIQWLPIKNMTRSEVADLLGTAKVYIDFGCHPGKDRIPREAAISGCCIMTGKSGSAAFFEDVSIPAEYKFSDSVDQIKEILETIRDCFNRYDYHLDQFSEYRAKIRAEKSHFEDDVVHTFGNSSKQ